MAGTLGSVACGGLSLAARFVMTPHPCPGHAAQHAHAYALADLRFEAAFAVVRPLCKVLERASSRLVRCAVHLHGVCIPPRKDTVSLAGL